MSREYRKRKRADSEAQTRQRITEATMHLHDEVGPAKTTVSAIADRAGVQRATVYRHFPDDAALIAACSAHWNSLHPPPDPSPWAAIDDPDQRLRAALAELYAWYAPNERMLDHLLRDREAVEPVAVAMRAMDAYLEIVVDVLGRGRRERGARRTRVRAAIAHGLEFETWRSLVARQGLSTADAVGLIAGLVAGA